MPVRRIGMNSRSITGEFASVKTKKTHPYESTLERDFIYLMEFDSLVLDYEAQPISLPCVSSSGRKSKYVPDFRVNYTKKGVQQKRCKFSLVEIKYQDELEEFKEQFAPGFKAAENYCQANGGKFEIFHDQVIRTTQLKNCIFLHRYLDPSEAPKLKIDFLSLAKELKIFNAKKWVDRIEGSELVKGQALSNLWHLIANGHLEIDLDIPITMKSEIRIAEK
jgi:hypothetical protein